MAKKKTIKDVEAEEKVTEVEETEKECSCGCGCSENCDCGCQEGKECTCNDECHCEQEPILCLLEITKDKEGNEVFKSIDDEKLFDEIVKEADKILYED